MKKLLILFLILVLSLITVDATLYDDFTGAALDGTKWVNTSYSTGSGSAYTTTGTELLIYAYSSAPYLVCSSEGTENVTSKGSSYNINISGYSIINLTNMSLSGTGTGTYGTLCITHSYFYFTNLTGNVAIYDIGAYKATNGCNSYSVSSQTMTLSKGITTPTFSETKVYTNDDLDILGSTKKIRTKLDANGIDNTTWSYVYGASSGNIDTSSLGSNAYLLIQSYAYYNQNPDCQAGQGPYTSTNEIHIKNVTVLDDDIITSVNFTVLYPNGTKILDNELGVQDGDYWNTSSFNTPVDGEYNVSMIALNSDGKTNTTTWHFDIGSPTTNASAYCWNSTDWVTIYTNDTKGNTGVYEEGMTWNITSSSLILTSVLNWNGIASCTVGVNDSIGWGENRTFYINITAVNDPPVWLYPIPDTSIYYKAYETYLSNLSDYVWDAEGNTVYFSVQNENTSQVDCAIVSNSNLTLLGKDFFGNASCTIGINDSYAWGANDTFTIDVQMGDIYLSLDGLEANRTYEYGTTANISIVSVSATNLSVGSDVYMVNKGINYFIGTSNSTFNASFDLPFLNLDKITNFTGSETSKLLKYRINSNGEFNITLPNYLTITSGTLDIIGLLSDSAIYGWDDMVNDGVTSKSYVFGNNESKTFNLTFRDSTAYDVSQTDYYLTMQFKVQSSAAYEITVRILNCTNCTNYTYSNYLNPAVTIALEPDDTVDTYILEAIEEEWIGEDGRLVIPFNITVNTGGNITFSDFKVAPNYRTYARDLTIDVGEDGYTDINLTGQIYGTTSSVIEFTNGNSSITFNESNASVRHSELVNITVPSFTTFSYFGLTLTHEDSYEFNDDFKNTNYIDTVNTTCYLDTDWDQFWTSLDGITQNDCLIYSKELPTNRDNVTNLTVYYNDVIYTAVSNLSKIYFSNNNGSNWTEFVPNQYSTYGSISFNTSGSALLWKVDNKVANTVNSYLDNMHIMSGLGFDVHNLTIDIDNDGTADYTYSGSVPLDPGAIAILNASKVTEAISSCTDTFCTFGMNVSYDGGGNVKLDAMSITYSISDIDLNINSIKAYIVNEGKSSTNNITSPLSTNVSSTMVTINAIVDGYRVVKNGTINITGSYHD